MLEEQPRQFELRVPDNGNYAAPLESDRLLPHYAQVSPILLEDVSRNLDFVLFLPAGIP